MCLDKVSRVCSVRDDRISSPIKPTKTVVHWCCLQRTAVVPPRVAPTGGGVLSLVQPQPNISRLECIHASSCRPREHGEVIGALMASSELHAMHTNNCCADMTTTSDTMASKRRMNGGGTRGDLKSLPPRCSPWATTGMTKSPECCNLSGP